MAHLISKASRLVGVSEVAIRRYEARGLIKLTRDKRGWRDLTDADIVKLKVIAASRPNGRPPKNRGTPR